MAEKLFVLIIILVLADFIISELLKFANNKSRHNPVPGMLKDVYTEEKYLQYQAYKNETYRFSVITSLLSLFLTLFMLFAGFAILDESVSMLIVNKIEQSLLFLGIIGLAYDLISVPFDYYETFHIEQKYGLNTTTNKTFILDKLKSWMLVLIVGTPVLSLVIWLYMRFDDNFWWMVWIFFSIISVTFSLLYSNLIVPLFNKQAHLEAGPLRDQIQQLADKTGFHYNNVYVIDGSKRSQRANAYFTGFGSKKRIVLYDTLISSFSIDEIVSVLAHEIGHYKKKHTLKGLFFSILQMGVLLFLFSVIVDNPLVYKAIGTNMGFHISIIVFMILYSPFSFILSLLTNYFSRKYELEADNYAAQTASALSLIAALKSLTSNNMSDMTPHPWFVKAYYSHPPLIERIKGLSEYSKSEKN